MDKVKITQEQAEVIGLMRAKGLPNSEIVSRHVHGDHIGVNKHEVMKTMSLETLVIALYIGYTVEETPEDKVRELYETPNIQLVNPESYRMGITHTLNALNIKIAGVNHD